MARGAYSIGRRGNPCVEPCLACRPCGSSARAAFDCRGGRSRTDSHDRRFEIAVSANSLKAKKEPPPLQQRQGRFVAYDTSSWHRTQPARVKRAGVLATVDQPPISGRNGGGGGPLSSKPGGGGHVTGLVVGNVVGLVAGGGQTGAVVGLVVGLVVGFVVGGGGGGAGLVVGGGGGGGGGNVGLVGGAGGGGGGSGPPPGGAALINRGIPPTIAMASATGSNRDALLLATFIGALLHN